MKRSAHLSWIVLVIAVSVAEAQVKTSIGYTSLQARLGAATPNGAGIPVTQAEAPSGSPGACMPNPAHAEFVGKTLIPYNTSYTTSSHATTVGVNYFGLTTSIAPQISTIRVYEAGAWMSLMVSGAAPAVDGSRVQNHSWISTDNDAALLRRLDYLVQQEGVVVCAGVNNGAGSSMPPLLASGFNLLAVGLTGGGSSYGPTLIEGARVKPDIVAPLGATSWATPVVAASAALLLQTADQSFPTLTASRKGLLTRALIMGGATKDEFAALGGWRKGFAVPSTTGQVPFDYRFGAGELNIDNSHRILTSGPQAPGSTSPVAPVGWHVGPITAGGTRQFFFDVPLFAYADRLSVVLAWNREILAGKQGSYTSALANMNLRLYTAVGFIKGTLVDQSISAVDNVEHIYLRNLLPGRYLLEVDSDRSWDFAMAWDAQAAPTLPADLDGDGDVDSDDLGTFMSCAAGPSVRCPAGCSGADLDSDYDVDQDDFGRLQRCFRGPGVVPPASCYP